MKKIIFVFILLFCTNLLVAQNKFKDRLILGTEISWFIAYGKDSNTGEKLKLFYLGLDPFVGVHLNRDIVLGVKGT